MGGDDKGQEWLEQLLDRPFCFWTGLPPCPKCGSDHGDPKATPEWDKALRDWLVAATDAANRNEEAPPFPEKVR